MPKAKMPQEDEPMTENADLSSADLNLLASGLVALRKAHEKTLNDPEQNPSSA